MRRFVILLLALAAVAGLAATDITGTWNGMLDAGGQKLRIVFHISATEEGLSATLDSPDQGAFGLPVAGAVFTDPRLELVLDAPPITYSGELKDGMIVGTFRQSGFSAPLDLQRETLPKPVYIRPQEPKEPYGYRIEEVLFTNPEAGIELAGTLTLPQTERVFPVVVMISGSGAQNRDEELMGHKPFWVIADHLTRNGIAVLRYDDRGVGGSGGDASTGTTFDFASDALCAVRYLKTRPEFNQIGLVGHSEGGIIAPIAASQSEDIDFIVLLAGTGIRGDKLLLAQEKLIYQASGMQEEEINQILEVNAAAFGLALYTQDLTSFKTELGNYLKEKMDDGSIEIPAGMTYDELYKLQMDSMTNPWMYEFIRLDPAQWLSKVICPVLALNGSKDLQVPAKYNFPAISEALEEAGNNDYTLRKYPGLNHLFQECETGHPDEYAKIEQTFAPTVLEEMTTWIKARTLPE